MLFFKNNSFYFVYFVIERRKNNDTGLVVEKLCLPKYYKMHHLEHIK